MPLHDKLLQVQTKLRVEKKHKNKFRDYMYRKCEDILEALKPLLDEAGLTLIITDDIIYVLDRVYIKSTAAVTIDGTSFMSASAFAREAKEQKGMDDAQITGSSSSYARKYALCGLFCIDDSDDVDAGGAKKRISEADKEEKEEVRKSVEVETSEDGRPIAQRKEVDNFLKLIDQAGENHDLKALDAVKATMKKYKFNEEHLKEIIEFGRTIRTQIEEEQKRIPVPEVNYEPDEDTVKAAQEVFGDDPSATAKKAPPKKSKTPPKKVSTLSRLQKAA